MHHSRTAFTLVELSIVLVILGLLVGGVLTGQSLIRAAEIRSVSTQVERVKTSVYSFRDKYFALPGDITNATAFWGKNNSYCSGDAGSVATPGTCNGNGDGIIGSTGYQSNFSENYRAWQQLSLAGLIEGNYTGYSASGSANNSDETIGVNVPALKLAGVGMTFSSGAGIGTTLYGGDYYPIKTTTFMSIGRLLPGDMTEVAFLKQVDAQNIDVKSDDGRPGTGAWQVWRPGASSDLLNADCATDNDPAVAQYKVSMDTASCSFNLEMF